MGGFLGLLSHQVSANLPLRAPTDPTLLAKASIAYRHFSNKVGFFIETRNPAAAREFAALYDRCGVSRCGSMNKTVVNIITNSAFPMLAASEIAGWPANNAAGPSAGSTRSPPAIPPRWWWRR